MQPFSFFIYLFVYFMLRESAWVQGKHIIKSIRMIIEVEFDDGRACLFVRFRFMESTDRSWVRHVCVRVRAWYLFTHTHICGHTW